MATSLAATLTLNLRHTYTNALDLTTPTDELGTNGVWGDSLANGTGVDQANYVWHDTRSLTATSETLDLSTGLTDPLGVPVAFTGIKAIAIWVTTTTVGVSLSVGAAVANAWSGMFANSSDILTIGPDARFLWWCPGAASTVDATHKNLKLDAGAGTLTYNIVIYGIKA